MRIVYISKYAATPASGRPTRQYFLARSLAEFGNSVMLIYSNSNGERNGHDINVAHDNISDSLLIQRLNGPNIKPGMNLKRIWSWIVFEYKVFRDFKQIKDFKPEIIIVSSLSILTFLNGICLKKRLCKPLVLEVRDLYPLTLIEIGGMSKHNPVVRILGVIEKYGYKNADLILSTLENTRKYFENRKGGPIKFTWLPMGINPDLYEISADNSISEIINQIDSLKCKGNFIVGYAGSIGKANALEGVMKLSLDPELINNHIHFVFIGNGPLLDSSRKIYVKGNISFYNSVSKKYLPSILKECDLLINTWLDKEIYQYGISPNKWIEYMFSGRPILLAFNSRSSIFDEADCGWQIPAEQDSQFKKAILEIHSLPGSVLAQKGKNGREYLMSHLDYKMLTRNLEKSLHECIKEY